jgi:tetratricopeptide (TPR) repeat protein
MLEVAATLDPDNPLTELFQGDLLQQQNDNKGALSHYQKALALDPESPSAHTALGMTYGRLEDPGLCYYHLGMADKSAGRYLKALYYFKKAIKYLDPKGVQGQEVLSEIRWLEG